MEFTNQNRRAFVLMLVLPNFLLYSEFKIMQCCADLSLLHKSQLALGWSLHNKIGERNEGLNQIYASILRCAAL